MAVYIDVLCMQIRHHYDNQFAITRRTFALRTAAGVVRFLLFARRFHGESKYTIALLISSVDINS